MNRVETEGKNYLNVGFSNGFNSEFAFWKFVGSVFIALFHTKFLFGCNGLVPGGYLAVEMFFLVTGYFFANSVFKDSRPFDSDRIGGGVWLFLWGKFRRLLPFYLPAFIVSLFLQMMRIPFGSVSMRDFLTVPLEFLLLGEFGIPYRVLTIEWYLSAMFITLAILYPVFVFRKGLFSEWIAPLIGLFCMGLLVTEFGTVAPRVGTTIHGVSASLVRSMGEICLGAFAWRVGQGLKHAVNSPRFCKILSVCGTMLPLLAFLALLDGGKNSDLFCLLLFFLFVCINGGGFSIFGKQLPEPLFRRLGMFGIALFFVHQPVGNGLAMLGRHNPSLSLFLSSTGIAAAFYKILLYMACCSIAALAVMAFCVRGGGKSSHLDSCRTK